MADEGTTSFPLYFPLSSCIITQWLMSFTEEPMLPAGARLSIKQKGIFTNFPSAFVYGEHLFEALGKSLLSANVFFISRGRKILALIKSSYCMPVTLGMISPAVRNAAFV